MAICCAEPAAERSIAIPSQANQRIESSPNAYAVALSGGMIESRPATPTARPSQLSDRGSDLLRRLTMLTSRIHRPPRNSPPEPLPSPWATGSIARHIDCAWSGFVG